MKRFHAAAAVLIVGLFCSQCTNSKQPVLTQAVKHDDYLHIIPTSGVLEAIKTYSINCPGLRTDATIQYLIPEGTRVQPGDTVCILQAAEIENRYVEALTNLKKARAEYNKTAADLNLKTLLLEAQVKSIETQTLISGLDSTEMTFASEHQRKVIELEMKQAQIQKDKIESKLEFLKKINESELRKLRARIVQEENRVAGEKEKMNDLVITASITGMIIYENSWTSGQKIREGDITWGNMPIAKIPDMSDMQVKLTTNDAEYKLIEKDDPVRIQVDAFPEIRLTGKVINKTPVGRPVKRGSDIKIFDIECSIDSLKTELQPGLSVSCDVVAETIPDTLVIPACAVFEKDSSKIVYVMKKSSFFPKTVTIVRKNGSFAVISEGLNENEVVALAEPPFSRIKIQKDNP